MIVLDKKKSSIRGNDIVSIIKNYAMTGAVIQMFLIWGVIYERKDEICQKMI